MSIYEVKQKAIDALGEVDVSKLSLLDLGNYVHALSTLNLIKEDTSMDMWTEMMSKLAVSGFNGPDRPTISELSAADDGK